MKRTHLLVPLFGLVVVITSYMWLNHKPYGDADILWNTITQGGTGEGPELSYQVSGRPLDVQTEFLPAARRLCKQNADATIRAALMVLNRKAEFFQVTFHYGNFFNYARFAVENGKVNCDILYDGDGAKGISNVPEGT